MSADLKTEVDLSGLNKFNSQLLGTLIASGQGGEGDAKRFVESEGGQLAWRISNLLGPKNKRQGDKKIAGHARGVFFSINPGIPLFTGSKKGGEGIQWLFASPAKNYLIGADPEDVQPGMGVAAASEIMRASKTKRGPIWEKLSRRGGQHVMKINRLIIRQSVFTAALKDGQKRVGQLRASFAYTASKMVPSKRIPAWISKHFPSKAGGKAIFDDSKLSGANPSLTFGSTAAGVQSSPYIRDKIARAVEQGKHIAEAKLRKVIRGYVYNWNTGQVFKPVVPKGGLPD